MKAIPSLFCLGAALVLGGCAINAANDSIEQDFRGRYNCSQVNVKTLDEAEGELLGVPTVESLRLMAQGCGVNAIYTCDNTGVCVQEKADERGYTPDPAAGGKVSRVPLPSGQALMLAVFDEAWLVADVSQATPRVTFFRTNAGLSAQRACDLRLNADGQAVSLGVVPGAELSNYEGCAAALDLSALNQLAAATQVSGWVRGSQLGFTPVEHGTLRTFARRVNEATKAQQTLAQAR